MHRRAYLALLATGAAGCVGSPPGTDGPETTEPHSTTTTATPGDLATLSAGDYRLTITDVAVRASVVAVTTSSTHLGVLDEPETQYVVISVQNHGSGPIADVPLSLALDGERVADDFRFVDRPPSRRLAFAAPVRDASEAAIVLESGEETDRWQLPDDSRELLGRAPKFTVTDITVPDRVSYGQDFSASFTVRNDGDRSGRFLFEFGHTLISDTSEGRLNVDQGATNTEETVIQPPWGESIDEVPVALDWGLDRRRVTVPVEGSPTPSPREERSPATDDSGGETASNTPHEATATTRPPSVTES